MTSDLGLRPTTGAEPDYGSLVQEGRAHGSIYTSQEIYEAEMARIFHRWWVYVAHESEIANVGDYVVKWIGRQSVIVSRDEDGNIHLLMNRCRHRGSTVCQRESGNSNFFRCSYHGWAYRNSGELVGVPYPGSYDETFNKDSLGLTPVPRVGVHNGFIFGSLSPVGLSFDEYIAPVRQSIDNFVAASPSQGIELSAGSHKNAFNGNWKFVGQDGYHPAFTHRSVQDIRTSRAEAEGRHEAGGNLTHGELSKVFSDKSQDRMWDLGNGHARLDTGHSRLKKMQGQIDRWLGTEDGRAYLAALEAAYPPEDVPRVLAESDPHVTIWPNLMLTSVQVRIIRPLAADRTEVVAYPAMLKDVPVSINEDRLRSHENFHGPAGFGGPDDYEIFERNQTGLLATVDPWVLLSRGLASEELRADGSRVGGISDEVAQRGMLREWQKVMSIGDAL